MTTNTPAPAPKDAVLTTGQILSLERRSNMTDDEALRFARAIESALLSKQRAPVANSTLPLEKALHELVSKIAPGLDTGDLLQDAQRASAMLDAMQARAALANGPVADTRLRNLVKEAITWMETGGGPAVSLCADLRAALASAPVAGEAQRLPTVNVGGKEYPQQWFTAKEVRQLLDAAPQASEAARDAGIAASEDVAPWTDFAGNPIKHGDRIRHPEGLEGVVVRLPGYADAHDAWCVAYRDRTVSRLSLQIGDRGQAVVQGALSAQPGAQKGCKCAACRPHSVEMRMILCEVCGDKRCPHAADHRNECVGTGAQKNGGSDAE